MDAAYYLIWRSPAERPLALPGPFTGSINSYSTVTAQIEPNSWLDRQRTCFGRTMVIFGEKSSKDDTILEQIFAENDHSAEVKSPKF